MILDASFNKWFVLTDKCLTHTTLKSNNKNVYTSQNEEFLKPQVNIKCDLSVTQTVYFACFKTEVV